MGNTLTLPFENEIPLPVRPFKTQLLKWIGNKQRFAHEIISYFPAQYNTYFEPFLGSGAVLGVLRPQSAVASDCFAPLIQIWQALQTNPSQLKGWYEERWQQITGGSKVDAYERVKAAYNQQPNGADLLFLSRACYGGVIRFRQADGYMSTPCGVHSPITPTSFNARVDEWHQRTLGANFWQLDYKESLNMAEKGDLVYCDPPYSHSQSILYGAQKFDLRELLESISECKRRGVFVALSIDGTKKSGDLLCSISIPTGLFEREVFVNCGSSMLKRFQRGGGNVKNEVVADRLLLTY